MDKLTITELIILIRTSKRKALKHERGSRKYNAWINIHKEAKKALMYIEEKLYYIESR